MARSVSRTRVVTVARYYWPVGQFMVWRFIMLVTGGVLTGVFAAFISIQQTLHLGIPWIFPFGVTVGALTIVFVLIAEILIQQKRLEPGTVVLGAFILFVLYLTGLIETAIQLFGPSGTNSNCQTYVNDQSQSGVSIATLAWLEQRSICQSWDAAFAFWIVGAVFLIWVIIMASQVNRRSRD